MEVPDELIAEVRMEVRTVRVQVRIFANVDAAVCRALPEVFSCPVSRVRVADAYMCILQPIGSCYCVHRPRVRDAGIHADDVHRAENRLQPLVQLPPEPVLPCTPVDVDRGLHAPVVGRALMQTSDIGIANDALGSPVCPGNITGTSTGSRRRRNRSAIDMRSVCIGLCAVYTRNRSAIDMPGACIGLLLLYRDDVRIGRQRVRDPRTERLDARHLILEGDRRLLDIRRINRQQIEVALLLVSPMLCTLIIALPLLVPLLYADTFLPLISMAQIALLAMYMRAITLSVSYVMLAKGDSIAYLSMESVYDLLLVLFVLFFYQRLGFVGTGVALVVLYFVDMLLLLLFTRYRYHIRLSKQVFLTLLMQLPIGVAAYIVARSFSDYAYWLSGILLALLSLTLTLITLHRKTKLWNALKSKFLRHG